MSHRIPGNPDPQPLQRQPDPNPNKFPMSNRNVVTRLQVVQ
jgi:hypothetical protein